MHRQSYDLQLTRYDKCGWRDAYTPRRFSCPALPASASKLNRRHRVGRHPRDEALTESRSRRLADSLGPPLTPERSRRGNESRQTIR
jgi:hypothetical protein